ncbi:MAG: hypothetical protein MZW92_74750 [Comamonadaceae bacterium]|nr:hypothetical protein [Comamonadaceae bacterium]
MPRLVDLSVTARDTERAIFRAGLSLGLDWQDEVALRSIVRETLDRRQGLHRGTRPVRRGVERQRLTLCALAVLMRRIELSLEPHELPPPGPRWQALSRVLDQEIAARLDA